MHQILSGKSAQVKRAWNPGLKIKFLYKMQVPQTQANTTICENHVEMMRDEIKGNSQEVQIMVRERGKRTYRSSRCRRNQQIQRGG